MFFVMGIPPIEIMSFQMGINNESEIVEVRAEITEIHKKSMDKNGMCSNHYTPISNFQKCAKQLFTKLLKESTNCSLPGICFNCLNCDAPLRIVFLGRVLIVVSIVIAIINHNKTLNDDCVC